MLIGDRISSVAYQQAVQMAFESDAVEAVLGVFERFRKPSAPGVDCYGEKGRAALAQKIAGYIDAGRSIPFVFPGFPAKSPNTKEKVLGHLPDMAEEVSFDGFANFAWQVEQIYPQGVDIHLVSDGYVFSDIVGVPDEHVDAYERECRRMIDGLPIQWYKVLDFFPQSDKDQAIATLMKRFGLSNDELDTRITTDPDTNMLYCGMARFMQTDIMWPEDMSKSRRIVEAKKVAREMMRRSEAYSGMIKNEFPDAVRLSCHPSSNAGAKFSWQFIRGDNTWATPWHRALLVRRDGSHQLVRRADAEAAGHTLVHRYGRPYNFQETVLN
jgi:L-tyrosine isonitrile synthase